MKSDYLPKHITRGASERPLDPFFAQATHTPRGSAKDNQIGGGEIHKCADR